MGVSDGPVVWGGIQENWFTAVNQFSQATPWLHTAARVYAQFGIGVFCGLLLLSWWLARADRDLVRVAAALWAPIGMLLALWVNQFLVAAFAEPRPYTVLPDALILVAHSPDYSFPSDHAVMAGAVAAGVLVAHRKLGLITSLLAVLMAFTRVYVGAHFPLDVAVGLLVGAGVAAASYVAVRPLATRLVHWLEATRVRVLLAAKPGI
ncbi:MAG: phosphatase PAP2 family protein [Kribbellaceae bacterium]|nr:phosphatase PAP2 family protein [Kribbellaceae bacterium]